MDCWQLLGVEPNSDTKKIKLAYSKLLKETRPDENPDGFQELRSAYKAALSLAKLDIAKSSENSVNKELIQQEQSKPNGPYEGSSESANDSPVETDKASSISISEVVDTELEVEWADLISSAEKLVELPHQENRQKDWEELLTSTILIDLQHRENTSKRIFCLVADACLDDERVPEKKINAEVLEYLNHEFQWEKNRTRLLAFFGEERVDAIFDRLEEKETDRTFKFVALAGAMIGWFVVVCGYFGVPLIPVVLVTAIPATMRRLHVRQWQVKRRGYHNGDDIDNVSVSGAKYIEAALVYVAMCFVGALSYGAGWLIRIAVSYVT